VLIGCGLTQFSWPRRLQLAALLVAAAACTVLPWEWWVYARTGRVIALSDGGAPSIRDGLTFGLSHKSYRSGVLVPAGVRGVMQSFLDRYDALDSAGAIRQAVAEQLRQRPAATLGLFAIKAARSWYATDSNANELALAATQGLYLAAVGWATWRAWRRRGRERMVAIGLWILAVYFWGMTTLVLSIVRYMVPAMGLLFVVLPAAWFRPRPELGTRW
jgi:hypothetical protein